MRSDERLGTTVRSAQAWNADPVTGGGRSELDRYNLPLGLKGRMPLSGKERNRLFLNRRGSEFADVSGISGVDSPKDGRSLAIWDYDRDGWQDIALANINTPVLNLYRNQMGSLGEAGDDGAKMVALSFVGGNVTAQPSDRFGARDGYGARATVRLADRTLTREHRCGEGLAAQNSSYLLFGLGEAEAVESIEVRWPSGISQRTGRAAAGDLVTFYENAADSPDGSGFERRRYLVDADPAPRRAPTAVVANSTFSPPVRPSAELGLYTSVATWCLPCRQHLPELEALRSRFPADQLAMIGAPVDGGDTVEKLEAFVAENEPPYSLDGRWSASERESFNRLVRERLGSDVIPATILLSRSGAVRAVLPGVPTVSDIIAALRGGQGGS